MISFEEDSGLSDAKADGYTYKTWVITGWNTRKEHEERDGEIRMIDERFSAKYGMSIGPMYPRDPILVLEDSINCRCSLFFTFGSDEESFSRSIERLSRRIEKLGRAHKKIAMSKAAEHAIRILKQRVHESGMPEAFADKLMKIVPFDRFYYDGTLRSHEFMCAVDKEILDWKRSMAK